ncbi:MAG: IS3 family transposase [Pseudonocardia sp.]|nr:IS3 family transposase [Pseudonocardia sp.]
MARKTYSPEFRRQAVDLYRSTPGATLRGIAGDLGISRHTLQVWVQALDPDTTATTPTTSSGAAPGWSASGAPAPRRPGAAGAELAVLRARVAALETENATLATERDILRQAAKYFGRGDALVNRFQFVADHRDTFEVKRLCEIVQVTRSSFYAWLAAAPARAARRAADAVLGERIRTIHSQDRAQGVPRITAELNDGAPVDGRVNHKRVARVMRQEKIAGLRLRRRVRTTVPEPADQTVPDLLNRDFTAPEPNQRYVGDITYLPIADGTNLYLATVLDCFSRRLAGWAVAEHMRTDLITDALHAARDTRGSLAGAVFHSDHGAQYTSQAFAQVCAESGVTQSMGAVGTSADNALAESFNASLKRETLQGGHAWPDAATCRREVFRWVTRYNTRRRSLGVRDLLQDVARSG